MNLVVKKETFYLGLFALCVIIPFFNNYELTFSVWFLTAILTVKQKYSVRFLGYTSLFLFIFLFAVFVGVSFHGYELYYVVRDITYLLKPIIGLFLGYQLYRSEYKRPFYVLIYSGVIIASYHLLLVVKAVLFEVVPTMHVLRFHAGYFNDFEVYVLVILLFSKQFQIDISPKRRKLFIYIMALSAFFYLARTNFIQFVVLVMALKGYFMFTKKNIMILTGFILLVGGLYSAVYFYNPTRNGKGVEAFLYKIKNSPIEAFKTKVDVTDWKDFHDNYRAYENIRTMDQLAKHESTLIGEGIGSRVDLKQKVYLGDMFLRRISFLHNGFMTVLVKAGIVGLLVYLFSIFYFFKNPKGNNQQVKYINLLFVGTGVFLILSNWVFMGFYNLLDTKILLVGFLFAFREYLMKKELS